MYSRSYQRCLDIMVLLCSYSATMGSANTQMPGGVSRFLGLFASRFLAGALLLPLLATAAMASANSPSAHETIGLGGGRLGEYLWNVEAMRQDGGPASGLGAAQSPCLLVGTKWQVGPLN